MLFAGVDWSAFLRDVSRIGTGMVRSGFLLCENSSCLCFHYEHHNISVFSANQFNSLIEEQTDTCVALEVKTMVKREFDCVQQARAWYASERCEPPVESASLAAGVSKGEG